MPVKHYSSGMYVRLGFAIAIHAEPEILLVDEVLAVGDAAFQRKCLEQIDTMRVERGVTILFVRMRVEGCPGPSAPPCSLGWEGSPPGEPTGPSGLFGRQPRILDQHFGGQEGKASWGPTKGEQPGGDTGKPGFTRG